MPVTETSGEDKSLAALSEQHRFYQRRIAGMIRRVRSIVVGQEEAVLRAIIGALSVFQPNPGGHAANGHSTLIGFPGTGKTTFASALARAMGGTFSRIQCTADLLPRDFTGYFVLKGQQVVFQPGPLFANVVLCDEYNRAPEKARSGVLQAKIEGFVSVSFGETHSFPLPKPNIILMTINPAEEGELYPIGEADNDRSLFQIFFPPLSEGERLELLERAERFLKGQDEEKEPPLQPEEFETIRFFIWENVYASPLLKRYIVRLTDIEQLETTLDPVRQELERALQVHIPKLFIGYLAERPALGLLGAAKVVAFLRGTDFIRGKPRVSLSVLPQDVRLVFADVLRHRIRLSEELASVTTLASRWLWEKKLPPPLRRKFRGLQGLLSRDLVVDFLLWEALQRLPDVQPEDFAEGPPKEQPEDENDREWVVG